MSATSLKENYQIIARKYRPQLFRDIVGQEAIVTTLKNAIRFKRLANAYLFCGSKGTGKTTLARLFAKALNCPHLSADIEPCNTCPSCVEITSGHSLNVLEIDGASNRGIDDIRQINETVGYAPASGTYKIYLIDEVHMLTKEAFNALLKTLEEPPPAVKFFFATTEPHKVLPTILSRCQRFDLNRISIELIQKKLQSIAHDLGISIEEDALYQIASLSEGSLRDAESLFDQIICFADGPISLDTVCSTLALTSKSAFFELDEAIFSKRLAFAFELSGKVFTSGKDVGYFLEGLMEHYRTLLAYKLHPEALFLNESDRKRYHHSSSLYTEEQCLYILDTLVSALQQMGKTPFKRVALEILLLNLIRSAHRIPIESLVRRLCELEKQISAPDQNASIPSAITVCQNTAPSMEEKLLASIPSKIDASPAGPFSSHSPPLKEEKVEIRKEMQNKYDTLIRFAAVELEGIIKKEI